VRHSAEDVGARAWRTVFDELLDSRATDHPRRQPARAELLHFALTRSTADPLQFLDSGFQRIPPARAFAGDGGRFMWCTAPLCHAAGRKLYRQGIANFMALQPGHAAKAGLAGQEIKLFDFAPTMVAAKKAPEVLTVDFTTPVTNPTVVVFHRPVSDTDYRTVMESVLTNLIAELDPQPE
jgi:hypothetical protein